MRGPKHPSQSKKRAPAVQGVLPGMPHLGIYRTIVADYPWPHDNYGQKAHGSAKANYDELPLAAGKLMPVGALAHEDGALLFLWCTGSQAADGAHVELARAWGFDLVTRIFTWVKVYDACQSLGCGHHWDDHAREEGEFNVVTDAPGRCAHLRGQATDACGCPAFVTKAVRGPGSYSMQGSEDVWLGVRGGGWSRDRAEKDVPEVVFAPRPHVLGKDGAPLHSAKPEIVQDRIERLWPEGGPRLELFARRRREGYAVWGNEAPEPDLVFGAKVGAQWPVDGVDATHARQALEREGPPRGLDRLVEGLKGRGACS